MKGNVNLRKLIAILVAIFFAANIIAQKPVDKPKSSAPAANMQKPVVKTTSKASTVSVQTVKKKPGVDPYKIFIAELRKQTPDIKIIQEKIQIIPKEKLTSKDTTNVNAFFNAVKSSNIDLISILLSNGYDINAVDTLLQTALHKAALMNNFKLYDYLLEKGTQNKDRKDINGRIPYELFRTFKSWNQLDLKFIMNNETVRKPIAPITFQELIAYIKEEANSGHLMFSPNKFKGKVMLMDDATIVTSCSPSDGVPIGIIKANFVTIDNKHMITEFESDDLFVATFNLIIPIGTEIITDKLILWGQTFTNCKILLLENGILEISSEINSSLENTAKVTETPNLVNITGTIDYIILSGDKCRINLQEYPEGLFYLSSVDAQKYGLITKTGNVTNTTSAKGLKVKISVADTWIKSVEKVLK